MHQENSQQPTPQKNETVNALANRETRDERVRRIYRAPGGALMGWLFDEARARNHQHQDLARHLSVTVGYLHQLRSGLRLSRNISNEFAKACATYLQVPPIVVKLVSGQISMSDFASPNISEKELVERAFQRLQADPVVRTVLPEKLDILNFEARRALVMLYSELSCQDFFALRELPETVRWLSRATMVHDESESDAWHGHRDITH